MTFLTKDFERVTFGVIVGNRDVFPDNLAKEGRSAIIEVLNELNYDYVIINEVDTNFGVVETFQDAKKSANLFKANKDKIFKVIQKFI